MIFFFASLFRWSTSKNKKTSLAIQKRSIEMLLPFILQHKIRWRKMFLIPNDKDSLADGISRKKKTQNEWNFAVWECVVSPFNKNHFFHISTTEQSIDCEYRNASLCGLHGCVLLLLLVLFFTCCCFFASNAEVWIWMKSKNRKHFIYSNLI